MKEDVKHQSHYDNGEIQPIQFMQSNMTVAAFEGFLKGNVMKYVARYESKNGLQDLKKGKVYLDWLIDSLEYGKGFELFPEKVEAQDVVSKEDDNVKESEPVHGGELKIGDICSNQDDDIVVITDTFVMDYRDYYRARIIATGDYSADYFLGVSMIYQGGYLDKLCEDELKERLN